MDYTVGRIHNIWHLLNRKCKRIKVLGEKGMARCAPLFTVKAICVRKELRWAVEGGKHRGHR